MLSSIKFEHSVSTYEFSDDAINKPIISPTASKLDKLTNSMTNGLFFGELKSSSRTTL